MAVAVRLAPGVGDDAAAFAARGETILEPVTVVGLDFVLMRLARPGAAPGRQALRRRDRRITPRPEIFIDTLVCRTGGGRLLAVGVCDQDLKDELTTINGERIVILQPAAPGAVRQ